MPLSSLKKMPSFCKSAVTAPCKPIFFNGTTAVSQQNTFTMGLIFRQHFRKFVLAKKNFGRNIVGKRSDNISCWYILNKRHILIKVQKFLGRRHQLQAKKGCRCRQPFPLL